MSIKDLEIILPHFNTLDPGLIFDFIDEWVFDGHNRCSIICLSYELPNSNYHLVINKFKPDIINKWISKNNLLLKFPFLDIIEGIGLWFFFRVEQILFLKIPNLIYLTTDFLEEFWSKTMLSKNILVEKWIVFKNEAVRFVEKLLLQGRSKLIDNFVFELFLSEILSVVKMR